jgi:hypothetical protein
VSEFPQGRYLLAPGETGLPDSSIELRQEIINIIGVQNRLLKTGLVIPDLIRDLTKKLTRNERRVILLLIGIIFLCYGEGWGADWKLFGKNDRADFYYDAESITRPPSKVIIRVWEKRIFTEKGVGDAVGRSGFGEKYKDLSYVMGLSEFQCADKQKRTLSLIWYSKDGEKLASDDASGSEWDVIPPGSMSETLYEILCKEPENEGKPDEDNKHSRPGGPGR